MAEDKAKFGFTQIAENWNGRLAMLGFIIGLATELMTGQGILSQIGIM
ncbi:high light inducible protein [Leptothoe spongobia TAU-MAC 1115]|uniref:High light inducible protein n=2 Tax=Leptothoe TaxID=2651725 RepID=A0A947DHG3_9CYAN|nr:high light inducible protein [Leptothoe spongobia TAU-MAC 1115]